VRTCAMRDDEPRVGGETGKRVEVRSPCADAALDPPLWTVVPHNKALSPPPCSPSRKARGDAESVPAGAALDPPLWTVVPDKALSLFLSLVCVCLLLQYLLQSCSRGG
jgi:hypothetical protein